MNQDMKKNMKGSLKVVAKTYAQSKKKKKMMMKPPQMPMMQRKMDMGKKY